MMAIHSMDQAIALFVAGALILIATLTVYGDWHVIGGWIRKLWR